MARTPAVGGASSRLIRSMRQRGAVTGERLTPEEIRAIVSGELDVEAARSLEGARIEEHKRQFDKAFKLKEEALEAEERAAAVSGAVELGALGYETAVLQPKRIAAIEAQTDLFRAQTGDLLGTTPAVTGAAGELGLSTAGAAIPETFTSAATGEAISTATGAPAASGAGALGTVAGGLGAFSLGGAASDLVGGEELGVAAGIAAGAAYGSVVPGIGTVIGGVLGGVGAVLDDGTVLCEELHRQGLLPKKILAYDNTYRLLYISGETYFGYRLIAEPIVGLMQVSPIVTKIVTPFIRAWAYTMANKVNPKIKVSFPRKVVGNLLLKVGVPYCRRKARSIVKKSKGGLIYG